MNYIIMKKSQKKGNKAKIIVLQTNLTLYYLHFSKKKNKKPRIQTYNFLADDILSWPVLKVNLQTYIIEKIVIIVAVVQVWRFNFYHLRV